MVISLKESESESVNSSLEICDEDVEAMKAECDKHFDVMAYCKDKSEFMTNYITGRNLTQESVGRVASVSPK